MAAKFLQEEAVLERAKTKLLKYTPIHHHPLMLTKSNIYLFNENHVWIVEGGIPDDLQKWWGDDRIVSGVDEDHRHLSWSVCCDRLLN